MKKLLFIACALITVNINAQTLEVPTSVAQRQDSSYWGGNIPFNITQWQLSSWISNEGTTNGTSKFHIENSFNPSNTDLNEIETAGGNIVNWSMYIRTTDSTFFSDTVPYYVGGNTDEVKGANTIEPKTWGEYYDQDDEMYKNTFNGNYIIHATDDDGNVLDLSTIIKIRNDYSSVGGYLTIKGLADINQANLLERSEWGD